jgi:hypothetical protein
MEIIPNGSLVQIINMPYIKTNKNLYAIIKQDVGMHWLIDDYREYRVELVNREAATQDIKRVLDINLQHIKRNPVSKLTKGLKWHH